MSKFNIGDKVIAISKQAHKDDPESYPKVGTIGYIQEAEGGSKLYKVQWQLGSTSCNDLWYAREDEIELFEEKMTNEEIWKMLESKMQKNGFHYSLVYDKNNIEYEMYSRGLVFNLIAIAYRSGYERAMKGRPFKIGEKKKKGGHWEPVDPNNLPKEGTKVKLKKEYCNYYGGVVESGEIGIVFHDASYVTMVLGYGINFGKYKTVFLPLDRNIIANCLDMWVEDDE